MEERCLKPKKVKGTAKLVSEILYCMKYKTNGDTAIKIARKL